MIFCGFSIFFRYRSHFFFIPLLLLMGGIEKSSGLDLDAGYRFDQVEWNIAGHSSGSNILSELIWKDIETFQLSSTAWIPLEEVP